MMLFFKEKKDPQILLEGLDNAQKLLDERYEKKQISLETYKIKSQEFGKQREKYQKMLDKKKH